MKYVMEAQRINADFWVVRTLSKGITTTLECDGPKGKTETKTLSEGETLVLKVVCIANPLKDISAPPSNA